MKLIIKITLFLSALLLATACEKDYTAPDSELLDVTWYTSIGPGTDYEVATGKSISFMDLSQGALSHEWQLSEGEGTHFLTDDFYGKDSLADYIDASLGLITTNPTVHVLFEKGGLKTIRLYNTFPKKVSYNSETPFEAKKIGDVWVIDTTITVDVYGGMLPAYQVFKVLEDGTDSLILNITEDETVADANAANEVSIEIEAGTVLKYVDMTTTDRPTAREFLVNRGNGNESFTDSVNTVSYLKLGLNNKYGTLKSEREESGNTPKASASKKVPLIVNVIASSKPLEFDGELEESIDETISFRVSGEIASIKNGETAFTVNVKNTSGFDQAIEVISVKANDDDASIMELKLLEAIYNSDDITVSYDASIGTIKSADERTLQSFSNEVVKMYPGESSLDAAYVGFENYLDNIKAAYADGWWFGKNNDDGAGNARYERVQTMKYSGEASMKFQYSDGVPATDQKLQGSNFPNGVKGNTEVLASGLYEVSFMLYLDATNTMSNISLVQATPALVMAFDISTSPRGEWVKVSQNVVFATDIKGKLNISIPVGANSAAAGKQIFYMDDISYAKIEERP